MTVRELRATDLRCATCGAAPGEPCRIEAGPSHTIVLPAGVHPSRDDECEELQGWGWQWQEVDPRDVGAGKGNR